MFKMTAHLSYGVQEYVCDTYEDLEELVKLCDLGDRCYVISENAIYVMNSFKQWYKIGGIAMPTITTSSIGMAIIGNMNIGE